MYAIPLLPCLEAMLSIVHFEAANVMVTLKLWATKFQNQQCVIWCDNFAVVNAFTNNKIKDSFLQARVRTVWLICARYNIQLTLLNILEVLTHMRTFYPGGIIMVISIQVL